MANTHDIIMTIKTHQIEELTFYLINVLKSKKVDKEELIQNLEKYNINIFELLKDEKVKVDKFTVMMIIDVCNNLLDNETDYVLSRSPILSILPKQFVLESRNLLIYLYQLRIELMADEKIDKYEFINAMSKFSNVSDMILRMVKGISENTKIKIISKQIILTCLDIVNDSVGIKTSFLINDL